VNAVDLALPLVTASEGCCLRAYPDPASPLSKALAKAGLLRAYKAGRAEIPPELRHLDGSPWTIGYGETQGVVEGMVWTQEQADERVRLRVAGFASGVLKRCPQLASEPPQRLAACTSLAYNIGLGAFAASSVRSRTQRREYQAAGDAFLNWRTAGGVVMPGLVARRERERLLYLSA
jgi:lysozyme